MCIAAKLKGQGIAHLISYFDNPCDRDAIKTKFNNISGKTGAYFVPDTLFQKRTHRKNRALIPYQHVIKNGLTYEQLQTFEGGVAVEFLNNDFFDELAMPQDKQSPIFKILKDKLGSDEQVSAIIDIRSNGESSSSIQRSAYENLIRYLKSKGLNERDCLVKRKSDAYSSSGTRFSGQGNEYWEGFIYYKISGGQQDVKDSHQQHGIPPGNVQLFNPSVEYANEAVSKDIDLVLIYFAFYSIPLCKRKNEWDEIIGKYKKYFEERKYSSGTLWNYVSNHICLNLEPNILMDPIQAKPISIEDFILKNRDENALDLTHEISVKKAEYKFDTQLNTLLSPARPDNLFWSKHLSNMMQQDFSLNEYFEYLRAIVKKWDDFRRDI
ncbi:hypothetical protein RFF20_06965 [Pasteurella multocida]|uniref:hypothetical protein n=1 Tax=Pasteurella multocida TaxID=747 RepID=UPI002B4A9FC8|nr:hypothetical protein [Pasteurella multocida]WRK08767.1 hypothetical protein RFF20_06965 [Pasteurella multocida]